ncbi:30S ribosomal protein S5 [Patescibacteria group bacterium]|nr:30S ribosomal protein S5 [Patescibacteria group bacterium]
MVEEVTTTIKKSRQSAADRRARPRGRRRGTREPREFEQRILDLSRVIRVTKGGKRMRFRTCLVIGDRKGRVGIGVAKGADVATSIEKAFRQAKKHLINVPILNDTLPHDVKMKYGAAKILLKPAPKGTGLKSGGAIRVVLELAGVPNAVSKILGSKNKINNAKATIEALRSMRKVEPPEPKAKKPVQKEQSTKKETVEANEANKLTS